MTVLDYQLLVGGVDLARWTVVRGTFYRPPVSVRATLVEIPGRHGAIPVGLPVFDEPQVTILLAPSARDDESTLDVMLADLYVTLINPDLTVRRVTDGRTEDAAARLVSITPGDRWVAGRWARATLTLALPGVFWRDPDSTDTAVPAGASTHAALAGSGPVADAVVRFAGPVASPSLVDATTGTGVSVAVTAGSGDFVYVDLGTLRAWRVASASAWTPPADPVTDVSADVSWPAAGRLQMWPVVSAGARRVSLQASHACTVRARRAWL